MSDPILVIGNKNYSSWSLRPWLLMKVASIAFQEVRIPLYTPESKQEILRYSPSGKVPCLVDGAVRVWDSLAIAESLAETHRTLWPDSPSARAQARSMSAEMHSGFPNLRQHMSMNCRKRHPGKGRTPEVLEEIRRIVSMWGEYLERYAGNGEFLFGRFSIADAMYAPVVLRFRTYEVELPPACSAYSEVMLALPAMQEWLAAAEREAEVIPAFEMYG
ncbi:MAG: glutathione S-transferase family protein [Betaproteobacteria bacterium]|nr:glutathione S-transferase family protein [Betaproteobacteria bacterium]